MMSGAGLSLPTDNLYKFICLMGLAIFLAGALLLWSRGAQMADAHAEYAIAFRSVVGETKDLLRWAKKGADQRGDIPLPEIESSLDEVQSSLKAAELALRRSNRSRRMGNVLLAVGASLAAVGGWLWYSRVQKYEDAVLRHKAAEALSE